MATWKKRWELKTTATWDLPAPTYQAATHQRPTLPSCFPDAPRTEVPLPCSDGRKNRPYPQRICPKAPHPGVALHLGPTLTSLETSTTRSSLLSPSLSCEPKRSRAANQSPHQLRICSSNFTLKPRPHPHRQTPEPKLSPLLHPLPF